jgi:hypothetical protein
LVVGRRAVGLSAIYSNSKYRAVSIRTSERKEERNTYLVVFLFPALLI